MATESYLYWLAKRFHLKAAETAWLAITIAADGKVPNAPEDDPVHIFKV
jgi:hypothetical protein